MYASTKPRLVNDLAIMKVRIYSIGNSNKRLFTEFILDRRIR
jgi:hypothetical protein